MIADAVEYDSDPDEVKRLLGIRRRREASDDEDEERQSEHLTDSRVPILSDYESDGEGGAPVEYDDEEEEHEGDLEEEDEEEEAYEDGEEEEDYEEEERNDRDVRVKGVDGTDEEKSTEGLGNLSGGNNVNGNNDVKNDVAGEGKEEEKKETNEPFAVPTAGAFYMHDDRFRDNFGGQHKYNLIFFPHYYVAI